jgi:VIT1/CCC1 family predicted Fe2+/Mn2+ transporter
MNKPKGNLPTSPDNVVEPVKEKGWLNTEDRISETLYGVIMALTFTSTIGITKTDSTSVMDMLIGALSCNTAWGLIDAIMFLVMTKTDAARGITIMNFVRKSTDNAKARQFIADELPSVVSNVLQPDEVENIRQRLSQLPEPINNKMQKFGDFKIAAGIFFLVLLSTFPVAIPFIFISDLEVALRTSNAVAILMMFFCGWRLGKYAGRNQFLTGTIMSLLGIFLVLITLALGG